MTVHIKSVVCYFPYIFILNTNRVDEIYFLYVFFLLFIKFILLSENEITIIMTDNPFQHPNYEYFHPYHSKFTCQNLRCYFIKKKLYVWSIPMNHSYLKYT